MNVNFEIFEAGPEVQTAEQVHVTINKFGHFFLNRHALHALGSPDAVTLMFDSRRQIIGIIPSARPRTTSYPLKRKDPRSSNGRCINAMNFCKHYSIRPTETLAFTSPEVNKDGILVLNLHDVRSVKRA